MIPRTIEDLRNPALKSGFHNVRYSPWPTDNALHPYQAQAGPQRRPVGPRRATGEEAAQDYIDYIHGRALEEVEQVRALRAYRPGRTRSDVNDPGAGPLTYTRPERTVTTSGAHRRLHEAATAAGMAFSEIKPVRSRNDMKLGIIQAWEYAQKGDPPVLVIDRENPYPEYEPAARLLGVEIAVVSA